MKKCSKCKIDKEETEFWKRNNRTISLSSECKQCASERRKNRDRTKVNKSHRDWCKKNREKTRKSALKYQRENKDKINASHRKWWADNGEKYSEARRYKYLNLAPDKKEKIREYARINRKTYRENHPEKDRARSIVQQMIEKGWLSRSNCCSKCGNTKKIEAHHVDYSKPLDVTWLCRDCHLALHKERNKVEKDNGRSKNTDEERNS